jgi:hypothetical protein
VNLNTLDDLVVYSQGSASGGDNRGTPFLFKFMIFIKEKSGKYGFYTTLKKVVEKYPELNWETVRYHIGRKKTPYITEDIEIYKGRVE